MAESAYSLTGLHLLENRNLSHNLKKLSFAGSVVVLSASLVVLAGWIGNIAMLKSFFFAAPPISLLTDILFIITSAVSLPQFSHTSSEQFKKWYSLTLLLCGIALMGITLARIFLYLTGPLYTRSIIEFSFLFVGLALVISQTKIIHRFHIVQLLMMMVVVVSEIVILGFLYQFFSTGTVTHILVIPINTSIFFAFLCHAWLLKWPNRGFVGMFTTDTLTTKFSLRILVSEALLIPMIGLICLVIGQSSFYSPSEIVALVVIVMIVMIGVFSWLNVKLLYKYDMEYFLMKESLRINNITIKMTSEEMVGKMLELEKTKGEYANKLNYQDNFRDVAEGLS